MKFFRASSKRRGLRLNTPPVKANRVEFAQEIASSKLFTFMTARTGPNISSWATLCSGRISPTIVTGT